MNPIICTSQVVSNWPSLILELHQFTYVNMHYNKFV